MTRAARQQQRSAAMAEARALIASGQRAKDVAAQLGLSYSTLTYHKRKDESERGELVIRIRMDGTHAEKLRAAAVRYDLAPDKLVAALVDIVITDDMFKAVLG